MDCEQWSFMFCQKGVPLVRGEPTADLLRQTLWEEMNVDN